MAKLKPGQKHDEGKLRFDLIPPIALEAMAQVMTEALKEYEEDSWQNVEPFEKRYIAALMRHLNKHRQGELRDQKSGLYHLDHILVNAAFLRWKLEQSKTMTYVFPNCKIKMYNETKLKKLQDEITASIEFTCTPEGIPKDDV